MVAPNIKTETQTIEPDVADSRPGEPALDPVKEAVDEAEQTEGSARPVPP